MASDSDPINHFCFLTEPGPPRIHSIVKTYGGRDDDAMIQRRALPSSSLRRCRPSVRQPARRIRAEIRSSTWFILFANKYREFCILVDRSSFLYCRPIGTSPHSRPARSASRAPLVGLYVGRKRDYYSDDRRSAGITGSDGQRRTAHRRAGRPAGWTGRRIEICGTDRSEAAFLRLSCLRCI